MALAFHGFFRTSLTETRRKCGCSAFAIPRPPRGYILAIDRCRSRSSAAVNRKLIQSPDESSVLSTAFPGMLAYVDPNGSSRRWILVGKLDGESSMLSGERKERRGRRAFIGLHRNGILENYRMPFAAWKLLSRSHFCRAEVNSKLAEEFLGKEPGSLVCAHPSGGRTLRN